MKHGRHLLRVALDTAERHPQRGFRFCRAGRVVEVMSYAELDRSARRIALCLREAGLAPGDRALLVYHAGLDFLSAFWGCIYAGVVAVPAVPPHPARLKRTLPRLLAVSKDCQPQVLLSHTGVNGLPPDLAPSLCLTDRCQARAEDWRPPELESTDLAVLQYTSGSTRSPRGVMLSHGNLCHNLEMLAEFHHRQADMVMVHWLPLFHDMGLIRGMLSPLHMGGTCFMMDPMEFAQRPVRWLQALSQHSATVTGAPDFGYALTARKVASADVEGLDLSRLEVAFCSAEPIRASSLERFAKLLSPCGFRPQALKPAYGLAEATVMVSGEMGEHYRCRAVSRRALGEHRVAAPQSCDDSMELVNCGTPLGAQEILIVSSAESVGPEEVGEVWLRGPCVAQGYWNKEAETEATFAAHLAAGDGPYLRTGDLGWLDPEGTLTICGRLKDLLIVRGQNFYPQDIEAALEGAVPGLRPGCIVAFATDDEGVVVVAEAAKPSDEMASSIWAAVGEEFGLSLREIALLPPGNLPKTASGKLQRTLTRTRHLAGELPAQVHWTAPERA